MDFINRPVTYNITQASELTHLSKQVIRKWEDRYGIVEPERLDNGYRVYNQQEIETLLRMKRLTDEGYSVRQAAEFIKERKSVPSPPRPTAKAAESSLTPYLEALLMAGERGDELEMNRILQQAYHTASLPDFLDMLIIPLLHEIGVRWEDGRWGEYQEALASLAVRDFLVQLRRNFSVTDPAPVLLGACLPNERHEIPLHIIALKSLMHGWKTVVLGPSPAPAAIQATVDKLRPKKVALSAVTMQAFEANHLILDELDEFASHYPETEFYIGGAGAVTFTENRTYQHLKIANTVHDIL